MVSQKRKRERCQRFQFQGDELWNFFLQIHQTRWLVSLGFQWNILKNIFTAIFFAQLFGLFPIDIRPEDPTDLNFKWKSLRSIFSFITIFTSATTSIFVLNDQIAAGPLTARNVIGFIFFSSCCYIAILMFRISRKLRMLMVCWMKTESVFTDISYVQPKSSWWSLRRKLLVWTIVYITLAIMEHFSSIVSGTYKIHQELIVCNKTTDVDYAELFIMMHVQAVLKRLPYKYNHFIGAFLEYLNFSYTFYWNFLDLFIILLSFGIAYQYEKINWRLEGFRGLFVDENVWAEVRFHQVQVSELAQLVNANIHEMLIVACFNDGYFILSQMTNITQWVFFWMVFTLIYNWVSIFLQVASVRHQQNLFLVFDGFPDFSIVPNIHFGFKNRWKCKKTFEDITNLTVWQLEWRDTKVFQPDQKLFLLFFGSRIFCDVKKSVVFIGWSHYLLWTCFTSFWGEWWRL